MKNYFKRFSFAELVKGITPKTVLEGAIKLFEKNVRWFVFSILFILTGYCVYFWYFFIYQSHWNETRKAEYAKTKERGAIFNENRFNSVVEETKRRKESYEKGVEGWEDVFKLKK
ncbi:MAG: hypothetical protein QG620_745 [Patescibacteria group bacterium]|nr:hypothetical protein [Patescibacteria group bacterium]